jgi:hypothetical protein
MFIHSFIFAVYYQYNEIREEEWIKLHIEINIEDSGVVGV